MIWKMANEPIDPEERFLHGLRLSRKVPQTSSGFYNPNRFAYFDKTAWEKKQEKLFVRGYKVIGINTIEGLRAVIQEKYDFKDRKSDLFRGTTDGKFLERLFFFAELLTRDLEKDGLRELYSRFSELNFQAFLGFDTTGMFKNRRGVELNYMREISFGLEVEIQKMMNWIARGNIDVFFIHTIYAKQQYSEGARFAFVPKSDGYELVRWHPSGKIKTRHGRDSMGNNLGKRWVDIASSPGDVPGTLTFVEFLKMRVLE